jgi:hypothetical protein
MAMLILVLGLALLGIADVERRLGAYHVARIEALYVAEAGIFRAIDELNQDSQWRGDGDEDDPAFLEGDDEIGRGRYEVYVTGWEQDPSLQNIHPWAVRIESRADGFGSSTRSVTVIVAPETKVLPILEFGAFACGNIYLLDNADNRIYQGDVFTNGNLVLDRPANVEEADVYARGNVRFEDTGSVVNCTVNANGNIETLSTADPNIAGDAYAGGVRANPAKVSGESVGSVSPLPVEDLCSRLDDETFAITTDRIADWRLEADKTIYDSVELPKDQDELGDPMEGIIHITGNLLVKNNTAYTGNAILVVDGNITVLKDLGRVDASSEDILLLVTEGTIEVKNNSNVDVDAVFYTTGNFYVKDGGTARIRGGVVAWGNIQTEDGTLDLEYVAPTNPEILLEGTYGMMSWLEVRN